MNFQFTGLQLKTFRLNHHDKKKSRSAYIHQKTKIKNKDIDWRYGMPASKRWIDFNEENIKQLPNAYGVYQLADKNKEVIYIGEGKLIHNLLTHLSDKTESISYFRFRENDSKKSSKIRQTILLKEFKEKNGEMPKLN